MSIILKKILNSAVIEILARYTGTDKALDLLKAKFTFTAAEIAKAFQDSHARALAAISAGLVSSEQERAFWDEMRGSNIKREFYPQIEQDYLLSFFDQQQNWSNDEKSKFRQTAIEQCKQLADSTLFQAGGVQLTEAELASFVTESETFAITNLVLAQVSIDKSVRDFLSYKDLLGKAILLFLHENLRNDTRMARTLVALQHESLSRDVRGLVRDVREMKSLLQSLNPQLKQAYDNQQIGNLAVLGPNLQQIESVAKSHQLIVSPDDFADDVTADLVMVQLLDTLSAREDLHRRLDNIHADVKQILAFLKGAASSSDLQQPTVVPKPKKPRLKWLFILAALLAIIFFGVRYWYFLPSDCGNMAPVSSGTYDIEDYPSVTTFLASIGKAQIIIEKDFLIQTGEVTVAEFRRFVESGWLSQDEIENLGTAWEDGKDEHDKSYRDNSPVSRVPWEIANQYAQWMSKQTGCHLQLPTQEQWAAAVMSYPDQTKQLSRLQDVDTQKKTPDHLLFNREEWSITPCKGKYYKTLGYNYYGIYNNIYKLRCSSLSGSMFVGFRLVKE
jgi:hypothetical protein